MNNTDDADDLTAQTTLEIGRRIKAVRRAQQMTIEALADASGLTKSFLSKIERGRATASVAALLRISEALGLPLASLFENSATRHVLRRGDYPRVYFGGHQVTEYLLTPVSERRVQVILSEITAGGGSGEELYPLPGEVEFVYVVSGELVVTFSDGPISISAGDSITFEPAQYRSFQARESAGPTVVLWMISPALPDQILRT